MTSLEVVYTSTVYVLAIGRSGNVVGRREGSRMGVELGRLDELTGAHMHLTEPIKE